MSDIFEIDATIAERAVVEAREMIGVPLRIEQFCHEATLDTIRRYAYGIGDGNPLWCDEKYAAAGPHRGIVAPPTFLYSVFAGGVSPGLPGLQPIHAGSRWVWYRRVHRGERIIAEAKLTGIEQRPGRHVESMLIEHGEINYRSAQGDLLATNYSRVFRLPRRRSAGGLNYEPQPERKYSADELEEIRRGVMAEEVRGRNPRSWREVAVGDEVTPVYKGPLDRITMTCYYAGAIGTSGYKACELRWRQREAALNHPETVPNNYDIGYFSEWVLPSLGHQDTEVAQAIGMPGAYDNGHMRIGWMAHLLTNWAGDTGMLRELDVQIRRPNPFGDTTIASATVTGKRMVDGAGLVDLTLRAVNQDGTENTRGTAVVELPTS
jgi:acyl dehydratase